MEKSIESIWKEGFLESDALVAPKINDLYSQKSIDIVDKFKRMYEINLVAIVIFSFIVLPVTYISKMPYLGILMFILFNVIVIVNRKLKMALRKIDKNLNSYQYLKSFNGWINELHSVNSKMNRYVYPYIFLSMIIGFWFGSFGGNKPGEELVNKLMIDYPGTYLVFGLPLIGILGIILIVALLAFFGGRIYKWDVNIVYGRLLKKLDEMLVDMEELRK